MFIIACVDIGFAFLYAMFCGGFMKAAMNTRTESDDSKKAMPLRVLKALPAIYDAALRPDLWQHALDELTDLYQARGTIIIAYDLGDRPFALQAWSSLYSGDALKAYGDQFTHYEEVISDYLRDRPPRHMGKDLEVWPDLENDPDRPDLKYLRQHFGILARAGAQLHTHTAWKDYITVQHGKRWQHVPAEFWQMLEFSVPHLSKALEIGRTFNVLRQRYHAVLAALDKVGVGMCVATDRGWIAVSNDEAQRIFSSNDGLSLSREGHLVSTSHDVTAELKAAIDATAQTANGEGVKEEISITCSRLSGGTPFLIVVSPLRDSDAELEPKFSGSLVYIIDPDESAEFSIDGLARIYSLSRAEEEVCQALIHGSTAKDIADLRGVSPETVRSQVRSIYAKAGVSSRTELIRLALLVNPPIR